MNAWFRVSALAVLAGVPQVACNSTNVRRRPPPDPADPPERVLDLWGTPPTDWQNCYRGMRGLYYNHTADHEDFDPEWLSDTDTDFVPDDRVLDELDWWDGDLAFQRYDGTTDFGPNWWPVDGGFAGDPQLFAGRWVGWLRVTRRGDQEFVFGASTDAFIKIGDDVVAEIRDSDDFITDTVSVNLNTGVYRLDVRYAHRYGETNGFRFRVASEDAQLCYPEFGDDPEE